MDIKAIQHSLQSFADERNWEQFHNPKNLAMALSGEVGELLEIFQWLTADQAARVPEQAELKQKVSEELADIALYLLRLADKVQVDLEQAVGEKMRKNAEKYPAERVYGSAKKYNEY